jgi:hypothetical protein
MPRTTRELRVRDREDRCSRGQHLPAGAARDRRACFRKETDMKKSLLFAALTLAGVLSAAAPALAGPGALPTWTSWPNDTAAPKPNRGEPSYALTGRSSRANDTVMRPRTVDAGPRDRSTVYERVERIDLRR